MSKISGEVEEYMIYLINILKQFPNLQHLVLDLQENSLGTNVENMRKLGDAINQLYKL